VCELGRCHASPSIGEENFQIGDGDLGEPDEHGGEAFVMRLGEEFLLIGGEKRVSLGEIGDAHREHGVVRNARLLRIDAFLPDPGESLGLSLVAHREGKIVRGLLGLGERKRDAADVSLGNAYYYFASKEHLVQGFYDRMADEVAGWFVKNFDKYASGVDPEILAAAPLVAGKK